MYFMWYFDCVHPIVWFPRISLGWERECIDCELEICYITNGYISRDAINIRMIK